MILKFLLYFCAMLVVCHARYYRSSKENQSNITNDTLLLTYETLIEEWENFKALYGKSYLPNEDIKRMQIFAENRKFITDHNDRYNMGIESYSVKMDDTGDITLNEYYDMQKFGTINDQEETDPEDQEDTDLEEQEKTYLGATFIEPSGVIIPKNKNWVREGAVTKVKDQGECGSCWAFSAIGALEGQQFRKTGRLVELSEQNLIDCSISNHGCAGGFAPKAFVDIHTNGGVNTGSSYLYTGTNGTCGYKPKYTGATVYGYATIPEDEQKLKVAVATVGPISVAIQVYGNGFRFYDQGVFFNATQTSDDDLNHDVLLVGYGVDAGGEYWLVKNSWGTDWGMEGYIKIARNRNNHLGIASVATYPIV